MRSRSWNYFAPVLAWLFPRTCLGCDCQGAWLCPACWRELNTSRPFVCHGCGQEDLTGAFCSRCAGAFPDLNRVWTVGPYHLATLRKSITVLKFESVAELAQPLGALLYRVLMRPALQELFTHTRTGLVLVPVPLDDARRSQRGFNQAALLAQQVAHLTGLPAVSALHKRARPAQTTLEMDERKNNLRGAFSLTNPLAIFGKTVILVDDVVTTGATALACAAVLREHGARSVSVLALARG